MKPQLPRLIRYRNGSAAIEYATHREYHARGVTDAEFEAVLREQDPLRFRPLDHVAFRDDIHRYSHHGDTKRLNQKMMGMNSDMRQHFARLSTRIKGKTCADFDRMNRVHVRDLPGGVIKRRLQA